jgi:hypothetical protein
MWLYMLLLLLMSTSIYGYNNIVREAGEGRQESARVSG